MTRIVAAATPVLRTRAVEGRAQRPMNVNVDESGSGRTDRRTIALDLNDTPALDDDLAPLGDRGTVEYGPPQPREVNAPRHLLTPSRTRS